MYHHQPLFYSSIALLLLFSTIHAWSIPRTSQRSRACVFQSRRVILERASAAATGLVTASILERPKPTFAMDESITKMDLNGEKIDEKTVAAQSVDSPSQQALNNERDAEKKRRVEEKEARRLAEDTKKRLAAGRIGRY